MVHLVQESNNFYKYKNIKSAGKYLNTFPADFIVKIIT